MKKSFWQAKAIAFAAAVLFCIPGGAFFAGCSSDSDGGSDTPADNSEKIENADGTTTLKIQENGSGFVSTTFTEASDFPGFTGSGYYDGGTSINGNIVYTVSATEAITDAKIAIHYCNTEASRIRGALVSVNGTVLNEDSPFSMTYTFKGNKTDSSAETVAKRWVDTAYLENVSLKAGSNSIIITGATAGTYTPVGGGDSITIEEGNSGCLNYVDYLIVNGKGIDYGTDTTKYVTLSYASENTTAGSVTSSVEASTVAENSEVTLTASPNSGWKFDCWSDGSKENPHKITVSSATYIFAHFIPENYTSPSGLVGYASVTTDAGDVYTITGGAGASAANTVTIASYAELVAKKDLLSSDEPKIITISGTISTKDKDNPLLSEKYTIGSNSTIYGDTSSQGRLQNIEFVVEGENVIIRNMMFGEVISWDGYTKSGADDALSLNGATHVWVDHCEFQSHLTPQDLNGNAITSSSSGIAGSYYSTDEDWKKDFYDGLLDIKNGSTWITISNCYFHDHYKACLCASGDDSPDKNTTTGATDEDMRVTFYHNYWNNINARMPLFRYGTGHIYDCYFDAGTQSDSASCINVRAGSKLYIEGNTFANFSKTTGDSVSKGSYIIGFFFADTSKAYGNVSGSWVAKNNSTANGSEGSVSAPKYTYTAPTSYPASVPTDVGVGKLSASDLN
ncbi:MAG: hypothetical protein IJ673_04780 [Treponema sp.]|nr:hypothetical protein [Treponema sp.]